MTPERAYHTRAEEKAEWGPGPWQDEPDKLQWRDEATGLPCLIVRNSSGGLCGYAGVYPGHPLHGEGWNSADGGIECHGGITFAGFCAEHREPGEEPLTPEQRQWLEQRGICHIPDPGEPEPVWWLGFDTDHAFDFAPGGAARLAAWWGGCSHFPDQVYRGLAYVTEQVRFLAAQLKEIED